MRILPQSTKQQTRVRLADFTQDLRVLILSVLAVGIGVVSTGVAYALVWLIGLITNVAFYQRLSATFVSPAENHLGWLVIFLPILGGLVIGLMARYGSEAIRGHGIPEALEAILIHGSRMHPKVAVLKPLSSAISIGTGGPFGAEGPIIMTGGAFGSLAAQFFRLSSAERRTLLVAGAAGGMAAIFATPIAAVLLAVELLLFEWKPRSFIPVALASIVAAALRVPLLGQGPIFATAPHAAMGGQELLAAFAVGVIGGLAASVMTLLVYGFEDLFTKLPIHWMWWPAIGGLFVGLGGWISPQSLGVGYDVIHALLDGRLVGGVLIGLLVVKTLIWSIALGSGTSGGVLAPLLIMGGALGALEASWIPLGDRGLWAMISMAAVMGGVMRSPFTATLFALELTHDLNVLPALLLGCVAADAVTVLTLRRSILTEKVARRGYHLTREYGIDPLAMVRVGEVTDRSPPTISARTTVAELSRRITQGDSHLTRQATAIVDEAGRLQGIITHADVLRAVRKPSGGAQTVLEAGTRQLVVTYPGELVSEAVARMVVNNVERLLVVDPQDPERLIGYFGRAEVMAARSRQVREELIRERGGFRPPRFLFRSSSGGNREDLPKSVPTPDSSEGEPEAAEHDRQEEA